MAPFINHPKWPVLLLALFLSACGGSDGQKNNNGPATPTLSIAAASIDEGDAATTDLIFTVTLSVAATSAVSMDYSSADATADQTDYNAVSGQLVIAAGDTSGTITVQILGDIDIEADERFSIALSDPVNATISNGSAVGTISNDDFPLLSIASATVTEGNTGTTTLSFDITMNVVAIGDVTVDYASSNLVALAGEDYAAISGTAILPEGDILTTVDVQITGDSNIEQDEQFVVNILNASANARIDEDEATGQIINDDFPKITIGPASIVEVDAGIRTLSMPLRLDAAGLEDLEVSFMTADGTATAGDDYVATNGSVTIPAGNVSGNIPIDTIGDTVVENSEAFEVSIALVQGTAEIEIDSARGTIRDNDGPPSGPQLFGSSSSVAEGDSGVTSIRLLILLDQVMVDDVSFDYATIDGSAIAPDDYTSTSGTAAIPAGETEYTLVVPVIGDTDDENDESFAINLSNATASVTIVTPQLAGTILDDDTANPMQPRVSIANSSVQEGDSGTVDMMFAINLTQAASDTISVDYTTEDDTATAGADYTAVNGTATFAIGETSYGFAVPVVGENFTEDNERFRVRLSNLVGDAAFNNTLASGTIITDEPIARVSIADTGTLEGDSGTQEILFAVSLNVSSVDPVAFDFATSDDTAIAGEDYVATSGSGQIPAGDTQTTIAVTINGDIDNEDDETFTIMLDNLSLNATLSDALAVGVITNDDSSPGWQGPQDFGAGREPVVDMNSAGNGVTAWTTQDPFFPLDDAVNARRIVAAVPQSAEQVDLVDAAYLSAAAAGGTEAIAVWTTRDVESSLYRGGTWTTTTVLDGTNLFTQVAANQNGDAIAVWQRDPINTGSYLNNWRAVFDPVAGIFLPAELVELDDSGFAQAPLVDINAAGDAMIVWSQSYSDINLSGVYYDYYDESTQTWTGATQLAALGISSNSPTGIAVQSDGRAVMSLRADGFPFDATEAWQYDPVTQNWTSLGTVNAGAPDPRQMGVSGLALDGNDNVFFIWQQEPETGGGWTMWSRRYDMAAAAWSSGPARLESTGNVQPAYGSGIVADDAGNAIAVWVQNVGTLSVPDFRARAARYSVTDQGFGPAEQIDDENGGTAARDPRIAMDNAGNAVVVWEYWPEGQIGSNRYVAP